MNIFFLHKHPVIAAQMQCDKHVVKMVLETAQMLSTAARAKGHDIGYKSAYPKHPMTLWVGQSPDNFAWTIIHGLELCKEYTRRYNKTHKSEQYVAWFRNNLPLNIKDDVLQDFPICMKDEYKISKDPVVCYKFYYIKDKSRFAKWKHTSVPSWYLKGLKKLNSSISCSSNKDEKSK